MYWRTRRVTEDILSIFIYSEVLTLTVFALT